MLEPSAFTLLQAWSLATGGYGAAWNYEDRAFFTANGGQVRPPHHSLFQGMQ